MKPPTAVPASTVARAVAPATAALLAGALVSLAVVAVAVAVLPGTGRPPRLEPNVTVHRAGALRVRIDVGDRVEVAVQRRPGWGWDPVGSSPRLDPGTYVVAAFRDGDDIVGVAVLPDEGRLVVSPRYGGAVRRVRCGTHRCATFSATPVSGTGPGADRVRLEVADGQRREVVPLRPLPPGEATFTWGDLHPR